MGGYSSAIWRCRYFWLSLVKMDLHARYRGSVLGMGWSLLQPIAMTMIFCVVFSQIFHEDATEYAPFVLTGLAFWAYTQFCILNGCLCFFQGESYIRQYPAPMAIYPLRTVLGAAFHLVLALGVSVVLAIITLHTFHLGALLTLVPTLLLLLMFGWGLSLLGGLATVFFRDTKHLAEVGLQIVFYLTPIMYRPRLLQHERLAWLLEWNPLMPFLSLLRCVIVEGHVPSPILFARAIIIVGVLLSLSIYALSRLERKIIFYL